MKRTTCGFEPQSLGNEPNRFANYPKLSDLYVITRQYLKRKYR